ncbi:DUF559 domain-containing protein [Agrococcus sp. ARC_14]|uniref:endonuclease domain-containing protein n=1 Tax=Agrococcus sp. ARC_14 TaxID=2919927 RepID=UPI001F0596AD|nr:DUF559 domain-containing protein [Agrococcus sp. ARC_14]MCH1884272.1 DUF559 domain-containing protein [Agrococcus sp. ARC_14]
MLDPLLVSLGVLTAAQLLSGGWTKAQLARAVRERSLQRLRDGWFAQDGADAAVIAAVRAGGCLSCASALRARGVWVPEALTVRSHTRYPRRAGKRGCSPHGGRPAVAQAVDELEIAFRCLLKCGSAEDVVVVADSLVQLRMATQHELEQWLRDAPVRIQLLADPFDRAESGTESMVRVRLRLLGIMVRPQISIWEGMRVDLLVGDRLVIECDSKAFHSDWEQQQADRARDRQLAARGYLPLRLTYRQIVDDWPNVERDILAIIRRGDHRWPRSADVRLSGHSAA